MGIAAASEPEASVDLASLPHIPDAGGHTLRSAAQILTQEVRLDDADSSKAHVI